MAEVHSGDSHSPAHNFASIMKLTETEKELVYIGFADSNIPSKITQFSMLIEFFLAKLVGPLSSPCTHE